MGGARPSARAVVERKNNTLPPCRPAHQANPRHPDRPAARAERRALPRRNATTTIPSAREKIPPASRLPTPTAHNSVTKKRPTKNSNPFQSQKTARQKIPAPFSHGKSSVRKLQPIPDTENRPTENPSALQSQKNVRRKIPTPFRHWKNGWRESRHLLSRRGGIVRKMSPLRGWRDRCGERVLQRCRASGAPESRNIPRPAPPSLTPRAQL